MRHILKKNIALLLLVLLTSMPLAAHATFVVPKRVMFEDRQVARALTIHNRTEKTMVYTFDWERRVQVPGGQRDKLKEGETFPGYRPADEMLIYSPRQVIVKPGQSQKVRIMVRRPPNLEEGEYHSHFLIKPESLEDKEAKEQGGRGLSGVMNLRAYMSIPVFVRHGKTVIDFELDNVNLGKKDGKDVLSFTYQNNSTRSFYAREKLHCTLADGTEKEALISDARVYVEAKTVTEELVLVPEELGFSLPSCTSLTLNISTLNDFEYKRNEVLKSVKLK